MSNCVCSCDHSDALDFLFDSLCQYMRACGTILECFMNVFACVQKPVGDPKPGECGHGCDISPVGVVTGRTGQVPWVGFCHTRPVAIQPTEEVNHETLL
jgi:hypothetical protein